MRDNVLFEFGLFVGKLGLSRSFIVAPRYGGPGLPSDLLGVNVLTYEPNRSDGNIHAALGPASNKLGRALSVLPAHRDVKPPEFDLSIAERRDVLTGNQRRLLAEFEHKLDPSWDDLLGVVAGTSESELFYRLEHLRFLGFVEAVGDVGWVGQRQPRYALSRSYRLARATRRIGPSASSGRTHDTGANRSWAQRKR